MSTEQTPRGQRSRNAQSRAFLGELHKHRQEVYRYAMSLERSDDIAAFVFDLLVRLAQHNHTFIDRSLIQRLSEKLERFDEPVSEVNIQLMEGMVLTLEQALTLGAPPPSTYDILNALFARGYHLYIKGKTPEERPELASKVIKQLPSIERLGAFRLSDFVDLACSQEESMRFWQLYVERVAAEVDRRTRQSERSPHTWTLSSLLELHESGPNALLGKRWEVLRRHIERITQSQQEERRWRYLRLILESCRDHRALYFVLNSPSVIEDKTIPFIFLTRGNRKLQSCALFILYTTKTQRGQINQLLEYFEDRSIAEVGERAVELYAQTQLFSHPSPTIDVLREGLVSIIAHKLIDEPLDHLLNAVTNDAHAFRQSLFLTEVIPSDRVRNTPTQVQLLERVLQSFFHTFTPSGVRHPLNDQVFQRGVSKAIVELMRDTDTGHIAHLKRFGLTLETAAKRWRPGETEEEESKRHLLLSYFVGLYVHVLRRAARQLYQKHETRSRGLELYEMIITLYLGQPEASIDSGAYEDVLPILGSLFPELASATYLEEPSKSRIERAVQMIAQVEEERAPEDNLVGLLDEWRDRNRGRDLVEEREEEERDAAVIEIGEKLEIETKGYVPIVTTTPVRAPVRIHRSGKTPTMSTLRSYLGLETLNHYLQQLLGIFGYTPRGELSLIGEQVLLQESYRRPDQKTAAEHLARFHVSQISGVSIEQPLRAFYLVFGVTALILCCFVGGQFLFAGVRGSESELGFLGLGFILVGLAVDAAATAIRTRHEHEVTLHLHRHNNAGSIRLGINRDDHRGQALINAFMAESVRQREEQFVQSLARAAEQHAEEVQREQLEMESAAEGAAESAAESEESHLGDLPLHTESSSSSDQQGASPLEEGDTAGAQSIPSSKDLPEDKPDVDSSMSLDISFEDEDEDEDEDDANTDKIDDQSSSEAKMGGDVVEYDLDGDDLNGDSDARADLQLSDFDLGGDGQKGSKTDDVASGDERSARAEELADAVADEPDLASSFDFITSIGGDSKSS